MPQTDKFFMKGRSQASDCPKFRFDSDEVFIRRDTETGDVILSGKPDHSWEWFVGRRDAAPVPDDFMADRLEFPTQKRELF